MGRSSKHQAWPLDSWAETFARKNLNIPGPGRATENWLWFSGNVASPIAEAVRTESYDKAIPLVGHALKWLCCFVVKYSGQQHGEKFKLDKPLSETVWQKYPGMCYACAFKYALRDVRSKEYLRCVCPAIRNEIERRDVLLTTRQKQLSKRRLRVAVNGSKKKPRTLDQWARMIREVYGPAHYEMSLPSICLHFIEEVGEVARALQSIDASSHAQRADCVAELEGELADVFSWVFGLFNKTDQFLGKASRYYAGQGRHLPRLQMSPLAAQVLKQAVPKA